MARHVNRYLNDTVVKKSNIDLFTSSPEIKGKSLNNDVISTKIPEQPKVKIRIAVFFDETLKNRSSKNLRDNDYKDAYSNITKLEQFWLKDKRADYSFSIYSEGLITDDINIGETGVLIKVENVFEQIINRLNALLRNKNIEYIHFDVFGTSRGAATARHFIYGCLDHPEHTLSERLSVHGYSVDLVEIKFTGLYDTIASYHTVDPEYLMKLHLSSVKHSEKTVHFAAAEEHRENYRLMNIISVPMVRRLEIFLPGSHLDICGGYKNNMDEVEHSILYMPIDQKNGLTEAENDAFVREINWLVDTGWYEETEIKPFNINDQLMATRRGISNAYSHIPLYLMVKFALRKEIIFSDRIKTRYSLPSFLKKFKKSIDVYIRGLERARGYRGKRSSPTDWFNFSPENIKKLRHDHLHFSAYYGANYGYKKNKNLPYWSGGDPIKGKRKRIIKNS